LKNNFECPNLVDEFSSIPLSSSFSPMSLPFPNSPFPSPFPFCHQKLAQGSCCGC
jgi:hypothetical protein